MALLMSATACKKTTIPSDNGTGIPIVLAPREAEDTPHSKGTFSATKALLDEVTFMAAGNELCVYDYYTPASDSPSSFYIPGATARSNGSTWPFTGPDRYEWTEDGTHKFYGWLTKDNSGTTALTADTFFGDATNKLRFDETNQKLIIPTTTLGQNSSQFDFMYSAITPRKPATEGFGPVPLDFMHLFSAIKVTASNSSSNEITLKSIEISGLKNSQSAEINYKGEKHSVVYTAGGNGTLTFTPTNGSQELLKDDKEKPIVYDLSGGYILMWPHTTKNFAGAQITVVYDYKKGSTVVENGKTVIDMSTLDPWDPGVKNVVGLGFMDKRIDLTCNVEPWTKVEEIIDFSNEISVSTPLTWDEETVESVDVDNGEVVIYSDSLAVAVCNFRIDTPAGATWTASLIPIQGHADAFNIEDNTKYGVVGVDSQIKIRVTNQAPLAPRHVVKLRITVQTADGRTIVGDLMPEDTDEGITEYKIIQNLING